MKTTYLITLTPVKENSIRDENQIVNTNFISKTEFLSGKFEYPEQTSILGMLRYELLKNANLLSINDIEKYDKVEKLVGIDGGFTGEKKQFGIIESISPVFIMPTNGDQSSFILPQGIILQKDEKNIVTEHDVLLQKNIEQGNYSFLLKSEYRNKLENQTDLPNRVGSSKMPVYKYPHRVEIKNENAGNGFLDSIFMKSLLSLDTEKQHENYSFGFFVRFYRELEEGEIVERVIQIGDEKNLFLLKMHNYKSTDQDYLVEGINDLVYSDVNIYYLYKIVLTSHALVSKRFLESPNILLAITETLSIHQLSSKVENKSYILSDKMQNVLNKSDAYELLARGSVIYAEATFLDELYGELVCVPNPIGILPPDYDEEIESKKLKYGFRQIGYNYFTITEIEKQLE